jgi:hypothetical protein
MNENKNGAGGRRRVSLYNQKNLRAKKKEQRTEIFIRAY